MKRRSYKFTKKKHTKQGMAATGLGAAALLLLLLSVWMSYEKAGGAGSIVGLMGLCSLLASVMGFVFAMRGLREEDVYYLFSRIGVVLCGVIFIAWALIFIGGM